MSSFDVPAERTTRRTFVRNAILAGASLPAAGTLVSACGGNVGAKSQGGAKLMKLSIATSGDYFQFTSANDFAKRVRELSKGKLKVQVFPNAQLASEPDSIKGLQNGTIECYVGSTASSTVAIPEMGIVDVPYLFDSADHFFRVMDGSVGEDLRAKAEAKGVHVLQYWAGGTRDVYNNGHAIHGPSDMKGMKLRVIQSPVYVATFKAFGAVPTPLEVSEVYLALKQGTLDGAETALTTTIANKQYEAVKYASLTHHQFTSAMLAVSKQWYDALEDDLKQAIDTAAKDVTPQERAGDQQALEKALAKYRARGIEVVTPDRAAFKKIAERVQPRFYDQFGRKQFDEIRAQA